MKNDGWLAAFVAASAAAMLCAAQNKAADVVLARFAIIYPAADPAVEEKQLSPGAVWLRRPKTATRKSSPPAHATTTKNPRAPVQKAETRVAPLRRERPTRETDPPKTRRRKLGW
jgi:hypothetical protein